MAYSLPRNVFLLLEDAFSQDREKAEVFAKAIEGSIQAIEDQAGEHIQQGKEVLKSELYNELRSELATKEFVRAELMGYVLSLVSYVLSLNKVPYYLRS